VGFEKARKSDLAACLTGVRHTLSVAELRDLLIAADLDGHVYVQDNGLQENDMTACPLSYANFQGDGDFVFVLLASWSSFLLLPTHPCH